VRTDVSQEADAEAMVAHAVATYGRVDVLYNNAGVMPEPDHSVIDTDVATWDKVMAVNVRGVWLGVRSLMPVMEKRGGGSIVITSSTAGIRAIANISPYTASKHAVIGIMRSSALEGAPANIRVNTVNPSPIDTRMITSLEQQLGATRTARSNQPMAGGTPMKRYGEPEEVARLMLFLASDEASFCTGGVYMVDGGVSAGRV
jgi:NAD(P)-dependent dehydrogenase (short-subunit alcohol dehydrogenase family)